MAKELNQCWQAHHQLAGADKNVCTRASALEKLIAAYQKGQRLALEIAHEDQMDRERLADAKSQVPCNAIPVGSQREKATEPPVLGLQSKDKFPKDPRGHNVHVLR